MMILPIHPPSSSTCDSQEQSQDNDNGYDDDTPQEWSLLELNGEVLPPKKIPTLESNGSTAEDSSIASTPGRLELGSVKFNAEGTPIMILGSHELKGTLEPLEQPFVVLRAATTTKRKRDDDPTTENRTKTEKEGYEVAGIIRQKLLFNTYPKIIMR